MKRTILHKTMQAVICLSFLLFAFSSCEKEEEFEPAVKANKELDGSWDVKSYTYDGVEQIYSFGIDRVLIEFKTDDKDESGSLIWEYNIDGSLYQTKVDYEVTEDGETIEINEITRFYHIDGGDCYYTDKDDPEFDLTITGEDLELSGNIDGYRIIFEAERE